MNSTDEFGFDYRLFYLIRSSLDSKRIIDYRVETMIQSGFVPVSFPLFSQKRMIITSYGAEQEVANLLTKGFKTTLPSAKAIGYKHTAEIILSREVRRCNYIL